MSREDREVRMCYEIIEASLFKDSTFLDNMENDWYYLYIKIRDEGWDALSDEEIYILYDWADEKDLFFYTAKLK